MWLPRLEDRFVPWRKITHYLMDVDHPRGGAKARFFLRFGFEAAAPEVFRQALFEHGAAHEVAKAGVQAAGATYEIDGALMTPDGRNPYVRTVWLEKPGSAPYLVTAYPVRRRG